MLFDPSCQATGVPSHPPENGSPYCELHQADFRRQKRRWYSARNNFKRRATSKDPGPWEDWLANTPWSPPPGHGVLIDPAGARALRAIAEALLESSTTVDRILRLPYERRTKETTEAQRLQAQRALNEAVRVLHRLARREPDALRGLVKGDLDN